MDEKIAKVIIVFALSWVWIYGSVAKQDNHLQLSVENLFVDRSLEEVSTIPDDEPEHRIRKHYDEYYWNIPGRRSCSRTADCDKGNQIYCVNLNGLYEPSPVYPIRADMQIRTHKFDVICFVTPKVVPEVI